MTMSLLRKLVCKSRTSKERSIVECAVCQDEARDPCTVPCGNNHVFCLACLKGIVTHGHHRLYFPCPMCRARVIIPFGGVAVYLNKKGARAKFLQRLGFLKGERKGGQQRQGSLTSLSIPPSWPTSGFARHLFIDLEQEIDWLHALSDHFAGGDPDVSLPRPGRGRDSLDSDLLSPTSLGPDLDDDVFSFEGLDAADIQAQAELLEQFSIQRELQRAREERLVVRNGAAALSEGNSPVRSEQNQDTGAAAAQPQRSWDSLQGGQRLGAEPSTRSRALKGREEMSAGNCLALDRDKGLNPPQVQLPSLHKMQPLFGGDAYGPSSRGATELGPDELDLAAVLELIHDMDENDRREKEATAASRAAADHSDHEHSTLTEPGSALGLMSPETMLSVAPAPFRKDLTECNTIETMTLSTSVIVKQVESLTEEGESAAGSIPTNSTPGKGSSPDHCVGRNTSRILLASDSEELASIATDLGASKMGLSCLPSLMVPESPVHSPSPSTPSPSPTISSPSPTISSPSPTCPSPLGAPARSSSSSSYLPPSSSTGCCAEASKAAAPPVSSALPPHRQAPRPAPPPVPPRPSGAARSSAPPPLPWPHFRKPLPPYHPAAGSSKPEAPAPKYFHGCFPPPPHEPGPPLPSSAALPKSAPRVGGGGAARPGSLTPASPQQQTVFPALTAARKTSRTGRSATARPGRGPVTAPGAQRPLKASLKEPLCGGLGTYV